ncbi:MAG TPA: TetR/AcrR family transcriptional regulator [Patescibacteria group bacterium]|nr:TetR/AcrR family transcriptional regulator [Patescibacteria group bacterium]
MSPAPARTSRSAIVAAARSLLEEGGLEAITMQAVADRVGVKAPSLYKRFPGRQALVVAVAQDVAAELGAVVAPAIDLADPVEAVRLVAVRYRAFARRSPGAYQLLFSRLLPAANPTAEANAADAAGLLRIAERLAGPDDALAAARLLTAFVHGFASMELAGAFRLGGDVDAAYDYGIESIVAGIRLTRLGIV